MSDQKELGVKSVGDLEGLEFGMLFRWTLAGGEMVRLGDDRNATSLLSFAHSFGSIQSSKDTFNSHSIIGPNLPCVSEGELMKFCLLQYYSTSTRSAAATLLCTFDPPHLSWWVGL